MNTSITISWTNFEQANIPQNIRLDIIQALNWIFQDMEMRSHSRQNVLEDLLAQRMLNIYLMGVGVGLQTASANFKKLMADLEKGGKS